MTSRYLAIDYGEKFIGLASFRRGSDPFPLMEERIQNTKETQSLDMIYEFIRDEFITDLIWGLPHLLDGQRTSNTERIHKVGKKMEALIKKHDHSCRVHFFDETLSTFQAKEIMKNSPEFNFKVDLRKVDSLAAKVILEDFLKLL